RTDPRCSRKCTRSGRGWRGRAWIGSRIRRRRISPPCASAWRGRARGGVSGRVRDVLLGAAPLLDGKRGVTIVEWRKAPIAEVFFSCEEDEAYEIEVDGRM